MRKGEEREEESRPFRIHWKANEFLGFAVESFVLF
jgi:hypothetical protein